MQKIYELIEKKREGAYWDFKQKHHENRADLLHDILCLANSYTKCSKYLIYGVSDGCEIVGVDQEDRRTQSDVIDFLRSKRFAGDCRPEIELRTYNIDSIEIDVLEIFDHSEKPYYLTQEYRHRNKLVRANHIYSRSLDVNTPIDQSADIRTIETLWRERLGLDLQPAQKMVELLKHPEDWEKDTGNREFAYHKYQPEYKVQFGEVNRFKDVYSYYYINDKSFIGDAYFKYLDTELFFLPYVYADEMRVEFPDPHNGNIRAGTREIWYQYFIIESRQGAFLHFMTNGRLDLSSRYSHAIFIFFRDESERGNFEAFVKDNVERLDSFDDSECGTLIQDRINDAGEYFLFKPVEMMKLYMLHQQWKTT